MSKDVLLCFSFCFVFFVSEVRGQYEDYFSFVFVLFFSTQLNPLYLCKNLHLLFKPVSCSSASSLHFATSVCVLSSSDGHVCLCLSPALWRGSLPEWKSALRKAGSLATTALPFSACHSKAQPVLTAPTHPSVPPSLRPSSGLLTTGASSSSVEAKFSNRHVSNYHKCILKMAQPFIVDMHAHCHPDGYMVFLFQSKSGPWGYIGVAEFACRPVFRLRSESLSFTDQTGRECYMRLKCLTFGFRLILLVIIVKKFAH